MFDHPTLRQYNFFTYDSRSGHDVIVPIMADDEDDAWVRFRRTHRTAIVDQVTQGRLSPGATFVGCWPGTPL